MGRRRRLGGIILTVVIVAVGCSPGQPRDPSVQQASSPDGLSARKRITLAISGELPVLSSQLNNIPPGVVEVEELINAGFATVDSSGILRPRLSEEVPSTENGLWKVNPDGTMETSWRIREGARWHDGVPFNSDDVRFTITQVGRDKQFRLYHATYELVESVETPSPNLVTVKWKRPFIEADRILSVNGSYYPLPLPKHLLEKPWTDDKAGFAELPYWNEQFVGMGPYKVREFVAGSGLSLVANDDFIGGPPKIAEIEVKFILDTNTLMANILSNAVDLVVGRGLSLDQGLVLRGQWGTGSVSIERQSLITLFPQFINPNPPIMGDVRFRRAFLHSIDRQQLADTLMYGQSAVADSFLTPSEPDLKSIEASIIRYDYNPGRAGQMIEGLGYARGPDGMFGHPSAGRLVVPMQTTGGDLHTRVMIALGDSLKELGVAFEGEILPPQRANDREYRATRPGFELARTPNSLVAFLSRNHGSQTPLPENNFLPTVNKSRYMNAEFDGLIDRYFATIPKTERIRVLGDIIHHMTDQLNVMGLFYDVQVTAFSQRLVNFGPQKVELASSNWNAAEWDLK